MMSKKRQVSNASLLLVLAVILLGQTGMAYLKLNSKVNKQVTKKKIANNAAGPTKFNEIKLYIQLTS